MTCNRCTLEACALCAAPIPQPMHNYHQKFGRRWKAICIECVKRHD